VWLAVIICISLLLLVYALPQMRLVLGLERLSVDLWLVSILFGLIPLVLVQLYKIIWWGKINKTK
jgi:Ca2+-transporting ATPase